jgi:glycosyltransferase involved in cell wall biosynthesis
MLVIAVPVYNEGRRAINTIKEILGITKNILIVINDGSTDETNYLLDKEFENNSRVFVLNHLINLGKGAAMKTGAEMAWKLGADGIIFIDADGQHNPKHLPLFEKAMENSKLVFGYRQLGKEAPFIRKMGNIVAGNLIKNLFGIKRKDMLCGFLGFDKSVYKKIIWNSTRYGIESEMTARAGRNKVEFSEIKIDTIYIDKYKGVTILDAMKILLNIPFWYFSK